MIAMVVGAVVVVGIAVAAFLAGRSSDSSAGGSDPGALDTASTVATAALVPATTTPPPTTAAVVTAPVTTAPPTIPPTTPPPASPVDLVSYDEAVNAFSDYLYLAASRSYEAAWSDLTPRYQVKYLGYDNFVRFWETVDGAGVVSSTPVTQLMNGGYTIRLQLWFGRRVDGTISNEIVEVDLIRDPVTGAVVIDDYRYIRAV